MLLSSALLLLSAGAADALRPSPTQMHALPCSRALRCQTGRWRRRRAAPDHRWRRRWWWQRRRLEQYLRLIDDIELGDIIMDWAGRATSTR